MTNDENRDESVPADTEDYYEALASQEQTYLDEIEENLRAILTSDGPSPLSDANNTPRAAECLDEQLNHAAEELIAGDSDDPPLSEETITKSSDGSDRCDT